MRERLLIAATALGLLALAGAAEAPAYGAEDPNDRVRSATAKTLQVVRADAQPAPLVPPVPQPARRPARTAAREPQLAPLIPPVPQPAVRPLRLAAIEPQLAPLIPPVPQLARRPLKRDSKSMHLLACLKPAARELLDRIESEFGYRYRSREHTLQIAAHAETAIFATTRCSGSIQSWEVFLR